MELKWLEDYLALSKYGSFSKAADARFVTQPAFSRRIRSLENWLGVSLVDRTQYPTSFTEAGKTFLEQAESLQQQIYASRKQLTSMVNDNPELIIMSQHSLAVSFIPDWLTQIEPYIGELLIKINTNNLHDSLESFLAGSGDFLLCFSAPNIAKQLARDDIECIQVAMDKIVPVTAVKENSEPYYSVSQGDLRLLAYPKDSFFGSLIEPECLTAPNSSLNLNKVCENALAEGLKALVEKGYGMAWLPQSLVKSELAENSMKILEAPLKSIDLNINIYRFKGKGSAVSEKFWQYLLTQYKVNN